MLQQYNRITQQQARMGEQLVGLSENSLSLQASLSGAPSTQQSGGLGNTASKQQQQQQGDSSQAADAPAGDTGPPLHPVPSAAAGADGAAVETTTPLEELLEQHLRDRGDFMAVSAVAVAAVVVPAILS